MRDKKGRGKGGELKKEEKSRERNGGRGVYIGGRFTVWEGAPACLGCDNEQWVASHYLPLTLPKQAGAPPHLYM